MPAIAPLEILQAADAAQKGAQSKADLVDVIRVYGPKAGYNNLCKLIMGVKTPEQLKGE
jgi:hypothetical protein